VLEFLSPLRYFFSINYVFEEIVKKTNTREVFLKLFS
jgi:hypothetical protein